MNLKKTKAVISICLYGFFLILVGCDNKFPIKPDLLIGKSKREVIALSMEFAERNNSNKVNFAAQNAFLGHRVRYLLTTVTEDVGMSAARKINVKGSLTLKYKSYPRSELAVTVISDGGVSREAFTVGGSGSSFAELDFSDFCPEDSGCRSLSLPEKNPCFKEKQIVISGEKFCSPIGIISLEYGCKIRR